MNNEKQHSEYKIIETVATPTFDGISVETHPEDQSGGGGDTPEETLRFKRKDGLADRYLFAKYNTKAENLMLGANENDRMYTVDGTGKVLANQGPTVEQFSAAFKAIVEGAGYRVRSTEKWLLDLQIGSQMENWDSYIPV